MSATVASDYVRRMIQSESRGPGDSENAMNRLEQRYGIGFWTLDRLRKNRAKTCDIGLFVRIKYAYLDLCTRQIGKLQHEIAMETAAGDDTLGDLEAEARALAEKIAAKRKSIAK